MACHENGSRRFFCAKIDVFADVGWFGVRLNKNDGVQIFSPVDRHSGPISFLEKTGLTTYLSPQSVKLYS